MPYGILIFRAKIFAVFSEKLFAKNKELNMKRLQTAIVLGVVALFAMTSSFSAPKQKTIKLGFNIPLTGDSPKVGESAKFAGEAVPEPCEHLAEVYLKLIRSVAECALCCIQIVRHRGQKHKVAAVIFMSLDLTEHFVIIVRACFLDPFQAPVAAKFASETFKGKNVAIVYNLEDDYSKTLAELFKKEWESKYGKVVVFESFGQKDQDFSVQLTKVVNSKADFLYLPDYYNFVGLITSQAKDLGWSKPVMGSDSWGSADLFPLSKGAVVGAYFTTHYAAKGATGKTKEFITKYQKAYGYVPDDVAALTYDATYIVLQAIQDAGLTGNLKKDRVAIKDAMGKIKSFAGVTGNMKFTPDGDPIKDAVVVKVTKDGEFEFVKSLQP